MPGRRARVDELCDPGGWSSYEQFRALLEAAADVLGGVEPLAAMAPESVATPTLPDVHALVMALGTPDALFDEILEAGGASIIPISHVVGEQVRPGEWLLEPTLRGGFETFPEYCAFTRGLFASIPRVFGLIGKVVEEECVGRGDARCRYRVWWDETTDASPEFHKAKVAVLEAQLAALQSTVGDLVSGDPLQPVLERIVESAARTVNAPCFVLALDERHARAAPCTRRACPTRRPSGSRSALGSGDATDDTWLVVDVRSRHTHHGRLAAINPAGGSSASTAPCSRTTAGSPRPRSTPRRRSRRRVGRRRPHGCCSSCPPRSRPSSRPTRWPRRSPAPSRW
ncbi:MAG: hypothetical protein KatS3mg009_3036 [Acidimicrobiia bacterium]|nr:MAG: hypothetical protein KatS3mg009_3036 [Acidimicrobiia bacterium]